MKQQFIKLLFLTQNSFIKTVHYENIGYCIVGRWFAWIGLFWLSAWQDSESFNLLGVDVAVSKADWMPVIVSALVAVLGYVLSRVKR